MCSGDQGADDPRRVLVGYLTGPTAVGKTELALRLAEKQRWSILSVDSRQIYRHLEIGTAKPTLEERARVRHLLIDLLEPTERCSAGRFRDLAMEALRGEADAGRRVLAVGGAGLYWEALARGLHPLPLADPEIRARHAAILRSEGPEGLHRRLQKFDPVSAARLNPGDSQRVGRALEVYEASGTAYSELVRRGRRDLPEWFGTPVVALWRPRQDLYRRIEARCRSMLDGGLVPEIRGLLASGIPADAPGLRTVGYREFVAVVTRDRALAACVLEFVRNSRRYAKRQETWIRHRLKDRSDLDIQGLGVKTAADSVENLLFGSRKAS